MSNLIKCSKCGSMNQEEACILVNPNTNQEMYICECCIRYSNLFFRCLECGENYTRNFLWGSFQGDDVCMNCSDEYFVCPSCTDVYPASERVYYSHTDEELCRECMEERCRNVSNLIEDYYYKPTPIFYGESDENCFLGVELEVDNTSGDYDNKLIYKAAEQLLDNYCEQLYLKRDGSLTRGFEIVTHPCTLDYHYNQLGWREIMKICKDGTLYTGITTDVYKRFEAHASGKGAKYTRGRGPVTLRYREDCADHGAALHREAEIKRLTRQQKWILIDLHVSETTHSQIAD